MPQMVAALANTYSGTHILEVDTATIGGATLRRIWDDGIAVKKINNGKWDYVVIQGSSVISRRAPGVMCKYIQNSDA